MPLVKPIVVSFTLRNQTPDSIGKLITDSLTGLKKLDLREISCIKAAGGGITVLLRAKVQHFFGVWERAVLNCFGVNLQEEFLKAQTSYDLSLLRVAATRGKIVFQV